MQTPVFAQTSLTYTVPLNDNKTIYTEFGDFIAIPCMWGSGALALFFFVTWLITRTKEKRAKRASTPSQETSTT